MKLFAQIRKVDEAQRLVFGRAAEEVVDKADEIMDYASSKPHFEKWSQDIAKDTDGKSLGNVRAMHGKVAAGKLVEIEFNDDEKAIDVCAKVVDDQEWKKVLEGVYTGFSIGGAYASAPKVEKMDGREVKRYTAAPSEVSLVDRPCIPTAKFFQVCKADGTTADVEFQAPAESGPDEVLIDGTPEQVEQLCKAMKDSGLSLADVIAKVSAPAAPVLKFADAKNSRYPLDTAEHVRAAWSHFSQPAVVEKCDAAQLPLIKAAIEEAWRATIDKDGPPAELEKATFSLTLRKGLYTCGTLANLLSQIEYIKSSVEYEEDFEGDGSDMGARLTQWLADGGKLLQDMVSEEVAEATGAGDAAAEATVTVLALSERIGALNKALEAPLQKAGARNSAADQKRIQDMHDKSVELGAACGSADKAHAHGDLEKAEQARKDELTKLVADAVAPLAKSLDDAKAEIAVLKAQPAVPRIALRAVAKSQEVAVDHDKPADQVQPVLDARGEENVTASLIKSLHKSGGAPLVAPLRK